jgi:hypothetical protein
MLASLLFAPDHLAVGLFRQFDSFIAKRGAILVRFPLPFRML